jgi:hypothetical protein
MYEIFTRNGQRKQLRQAAEMLAHEEQEDIDYANGAGYAVMMRMRIQDPNDYRVQDAISKARTERERWREHGHQTRARDFQIQQLEAQQQARVDEAAQTEVRATIDNQMAQLRPRAFKAIGIPDNALNDQRLRAHMGAIARQQGLAKVTPELVMDAARALREEIDDERRAANTNGTPPAATPKPFTPSLGAGGAGKISGAQKRNGSTVEEFGEKWGVRGW